MKASGPMMCIKPYVGATGIPYGCGQCMHCRYNRRRIWMHRIMLEAAQYENNCFLTLTYDDEHLPEGGNLVLRDYQLFLKRLRERVAPERFRYYFVGEYGDESQRPHYHAALFGFGSCQYGDTRVYCVKRPCSQCKLVRDVWGKGNIMLGRLEDDSAGYICGYVTKKMTRKDDPRLNGRVPEFGRMSLRPGIGYTALWEIADAILRYELAQKEGDVPEGLRHGSKVLPLGRYLRGRLRQMTGVNSDEAAQKVVEKMAAEMLPLRLAARASSENPSVAQHLVDANEGRRRNAEARQRLYKSKRSI